LEKLSYLLDLHFNWGQAFSSEAAFQTILRCALNISGAERGFVLLKQPAGFRFQVGMDGTGSCLPESEFRTSQSVVQHVADHAQPVLMTEQIGGEFARQESIVAMNLRALACLPLVATIPGSSSQELLGILYLDSRKQMHALSVLDRKIMSKLAEQAGAVLEKVETIKAFEEQKKVEQDLIQAREIQRSLLPREIPRLEGFHIHHFNHPTRHVGGDFYDFLTLDSGELIGILADVSGKGVPAALLASLVQGALHMEFRTSSRCDTVLNRVNKFLCEKAVAGRFVTLFAASLDAQGTGHYISAGHNTAYLYRRSTGSIEELPSGGLILGAFSFAAYECAPLQLCEGDLLIVYSDGLTEAEGPGGEMFGEDRLRELIQQEGGAGSHALERKLLGAMEEFTRGMAQTDDITFVLVEKRPPEKAH
jgi:serine phosphatase RsbU (regulator of sigma subunit)